MTENENVAASGDPAAPPAAPPDAAALWAAEKEKSADYFDQLLRLKAEFENYRKRSERERAEARRWGKEEIVLRLVQLMDVMEQAEAAAHKTTDMKAIVTGLDMLYGEFKRLLRDEGLEEVRCAEGDALDPAVQEVVETVEGDGEPNKVLGVYQKGWRLGGALLRPARVKVTAAKKLSADAPQL